MRSSRRPLPAQLLTRASGPRVSARRCRLWPRMRRMCSAVSVAAAAAPATAAPETYDQARLAPPAACAAHADTHEGWRDVVVGGTLPVLLRSARLRGDDGANVGPGAASEPAPLSGDAAGEATVESPAERGLRFASAYGSVARRRGGGCRRRAGLGSIPGRCGCPQNWTTLLRRRLLSSDS